ncbi:MAG: hypothetical protein PHQ54_05320, partial [Candidatus Omnitrophica bacterium]|nr:hypothetical protein [Candidatus Omnitrophota bacterium]
MAQFKKAILSFSFISLFLISLARICPAQIELNNPARIGTGRLNLSPGPFTGTASSALRRPITTDVAGQDPIRDPARTRALEPIDLLIGDYLNIPDWRDNYSLYAPLIEAFRNLFSGYQDPDIERILADSIPDSPFKNMVIAVARWRAICRNKSSEEISGIFRELKLFPLGEQVLAENKTKTFVIQRSIISIDVFSTASAVSFSGKQLKLSLGITEDTLAGLTSLEVIIGTDTKYDILTELRAATPDGDGIRTVTLDIPENDDLENISQLRLVFEGPRNIFFEIKISSISLMSPSLYITPEETAQAELFLSHLALLKDWDFQNREDLAYIDYLLTKDPRILERMEGAAQTFSALTWRNPYIEYWNIMDELLIEFLTESGSTTNLADNTALRSRSLFALDYFLGREADLSNSFDAALWSALIDDNALLENRGPMAVIDLIRIDSELKNLYQERWNIIAGLLPDEIRAELDPAGYTTFSEFMQNTGFDIFVKYLMLLPQRDLAREIAATVPDMSKYSDMAQFRYDLRINVSSRILEYLSREGMPTGSLPLYIDKDALIGHVT